MGRYILRNLNNVEIKEQYQVKISNRFAALENLDGGGGGGDNDDDNDVDMSKTWEGITENMKASATESIGYYELNQYRQIIRS
jgi:hypothetical protein